MQRKYVRRFHVSYWPTEGHTITMATTIDETLESEVIATIPCNDTEADYKRARKQAATILRALRHHVPRVRYLGGLRTRNGVTGGGCYERVYNIPAMMPIEV